MLRSLALPGLVAFSTVFAAVAVAQPARPPVPPVAAYAAKPAVESITLSPSGQKLAVFGTSNGQSRIAISTLDGKPITVIGVGTQKLRNVVWAGEDYVLVFLTATVAPTDLGGPRGEYGQVVTVDLKAKSSRTLFEHDPKFLPAELGFFGARQINGRWYMFVRGLSYNPRAVNLWRVDLATGAATQAAPGDLGGGEWVDDWAVGPEGQVLARAISREEYKTWRIMAGPDGNRVLKSGKSDFGKPSLVGMGRAANSVVIGSYDDEGQLRFEEVSLADGSVLGSLGPVGSLVGAEVDERGRVIGLNVRDATDGRSHPVYLDPQLDAKAGKIRKAFAPNWADIVSMDDAKTAAVVFTHGASDSGGFWLVDLATMKGDPLADARPAIPPEAIGPVSVFTYKAQDGTELQAVLTLPPGREAKNLPVVVLPHGGPESRDAPDFDWLAQPYASRGYAVIQPNFRGSAGVGHALRDAGFGEWGRKMQTDVSDALAAAAAKGIVDPKRACIVGASYGGYAALAGVTVQQGVYRCAVSYGGIGDLADMLAYARAESGGKSDETRYWKRFMGVESATDPVLQRYSPTALAERADAPILLVHGKDDTVVPHRQSDNMASALKRAGKPYTLTILDGEDHWLSGEATRIKFITDAVAFVEKYNPPN